MEPKCALPTEYLLHPDSFELLMLPSYCSLNSISTVKEKLRYQSSHFIVFIDFARLCMKSALTLLGHHLNFSHVVFSHCPRSHTINIIFNGSDEISALSYSNFQPK